MSKKSKKLSFARRAFKFFGLLFLLVLGVAILGYFATPQQERQNLLVYLEKLLPSGHVTKVNDEIVAETDATAKVEEEPTAILTTLGGGDDPIGDAVLASQAENVSYDENAKTTVATNTKKGKPVIYSFSEKGDFAKAFSRDYTTAAFGLAEKKEWSKATTLVVATNEAYSFLKNNPKTPWAELSPWNGTMKKLISKEMSNRKSDTPKVSSPSPTIRGQRLSNEKKDPELKLGELQVSPQVMNLLTDFLNGRVDKEGNLNNLHVTSMEKNSFLNKIEKAGGDKETVGNALFEKKDFGYNIKQNVKFVAKS